MQSGNHLLYYLCRCIEVTLDVGLINNTDNNVYSNQTNGGLGCP